MQERVCTKCRESKSETAFGTRNDRDKPRRQSRCKRRRVIDAEDSRMRCQYGVSLADRDQMEVRQGGTCAICHRRPTGKRANAKLHVDHCHRTGKVRGLLCGNCNKTLGLMQDDPGWLRIAADYVENYGNRTS